MKIKSIDRPGTRRNGVGGDHLGSALAQLFSSAAGCGDPEDCAKRIEAGAKFREAKERKREKAREGRNRKKAAAPIAKAIVARNWALNGEAEEVSVAPEYQAFLRVLLDTMYGAKERDNAPPPGIPMRIAAETINTSAGEYAPIFRAALRLLNSEDRRSGQLPERKKSLRKKSTVTLVQVAAEPQRTQLEEVKEQLRASNGRLQKLSRDRSKRVQVDYPATLKDAVLDWIERVESLSSALALEVHRLALEFVRLEEAAIAKAFREKLVRIEIFPPTTIRDLFCGEIEWREVSVE